jgi:hypothetical protein
MVIDLESNNLEEVIWNDEKDVLGWDCLLDIERLAKSVDGEGETEFRLAVSNTR